MGLPAFVALTTTLSITTAGCCNLPQHADTIPKLPTARNRNASADVKRPNGKSFGLSDA